MKWLLNFSLVDQLEFYGSYHNNRWNQLIHFIFVPAIFWSVAVWLAYTPPILPGNLPDALTRQGVPAWFAELVPENAAFILCVLYVGFYCLLDLFAGLTWAGFVAPPILLTANAFRQHVAHAWQWALAVHVFSWYMQIHPGHAVLERRKPALLDSFFQSLVLAPLFVWFELLFLLGYRARLRAELQRRVEANIAQFRAKEGGPLLQSSAE